MSTGIDRATGILESAGGVVRSDLEYICGALAREMTALEGRRLLITGGAGFLGYYLVQAVLFWNERRPARPIAVTICDNYRRGIPPWLSRLESDPAVRLIEHDIARPLPADLEPADYVVHAASIASPTYYRQHPIDTMDANVLGLRRLLDWAVAIKGGDRPVRGFLFFSTSEIYGDPPATHIPTPETYRGNVSCTGPRACYDESKRYGETLSVTFARQHGLPVTIVRPFNNYGPGLRLTDRRVVADVARDILDGRDVTLMSDGAATRTFCYVADAVIGYFKVLLIGEPGEPYNIGADAPEVTMAELAERLVAQGRTLLGYRGAVRYARSPDRDYLVDNPVRRCPDISKARRQLGFSPAVDLDEGLRRTLLWYRDSREAEAP